MPATSRLTRKQLRQRIGISAGAINMDAGAATHTISESAISAAKFVDEYLPFGTQDEHRGRWVLWTDSGSSVEVRRVSESNPDERSITLSVPLGATPTSSGTYELWEQESNPISLHSFMNDAITEMARKGAVSAEATFHTGGDNRAYGLSSAWLGVREVAYRVTYFGRTLATMDTAPDSLTANTAVALDSSDYREGAGAVRLTVAAGESSATAIANSSFAAVDIRGYDQVEFWFKTSGAITSSGFKVQIMQGSSAQVEVSLPASSGDLWTYHTASISAPENNSSVTSVQASTGSSDAGAAVVWLDDVKVTRSKSGVFKPVPRDFWSLSQQNREVRLDEWNGGYRMLRITGVRRPVELNSDSAVCEVDANYIQNYARGYMLLSNSDNNAGQRDAAANNAQTYLQIAYNQRNRMSMPSNIRWLDD